MTLENVFLDVGSIGMGVQSTGMLFAQEMGLLNRTNVNYFADLGRESKEVYDYMDYSMPILKRYGIEVSVIKTSDIYNHILSWDIEDRVSMIPVWFLVNGKPQPLNRQCTSDFKINIIAKKIREDYAIKRFKRWSVRMWQGISLDEQSRVKRTKLFPEDQLTYRINHYPFIEKYATITAPNTKYLNFTREDIIENIFKKLGLKIPPKSSCFFCPFHDILYWYHIYLTQPEEWELSCVLDDSIRHYNSSNSTMRNGPFYLYKGCIPLREIDFEKEIAKAKKNEGLLFEGCETGFCFT